VAIVGTRDSTPYGERVARALGIAVARAGGCVLSGLARGIDATAHRAALEVGGRTAAVLGTGVDVPYPVGHRELQRRIAASGVVISEFAPGSRAQRGSFPRRNRLIAALATVTVVVEAGVQSGARNTADHALDLGRNVAAVPGPIDSPQSAGANLLIRDGAHVIVTADDLLALAGLAPRAATVAPDASPSEQLVWRSLDAGPLDIDTLTLRSGLPARECLAAVTALEMFGAIECDLTGAIRRR
jgi:DNA processing protein